MKIEKLIEKLNEVLNEKGNVTVCTFDSACEEYSENVCLEVIEDDYYLNIHEEVVEDKFLLL